MGMYNETMTRKEILEIIARDRWMMDILAEVEKLQLPDWMIGAGFVRNKIWDVLHEYKERTPLNDIDMIYFDPAAPPVEDEKRIWKILKTARPDVIWSVTNTAHRHQKTGEEAYHSSEDALAHWVETPTCVAVTLKEGELELIAPHGIEDLVALRVKPSPYYLDNIEPYRARVQKKNWQQIWPKLNILLD
jgi:hypothetical protein